MEHWEKWLAEIKSLTNGTATVKTVYETYDKITIHVSWTHNDKRYGVSRSIDCDTLLSYKGNSTLYMTEMITRDVRDVVENYKEQDVCTDGDNCRRCKTHVNHRGSIPHAGIPMGDSFGAKETE